MTRHCIFHYLLIAGLVTTLGACSSSDSDTKQLPDDEEISEQEPSEQDIADEQMTESADSTTDAPQVDDTVSEPVDAADVLIPPLVSGSDLERVAQGLTRQAAATLLDLNQRISQGETLTAQHEQCLGSFEEGFGEPLMAVNCDQPLATGDVELWVGEAAFFDTAICRESLFNQGSEGCVLERMTLTIRTEFIPAAENTGNGRPTLGFPGALLSYGIDEPVLSMQSLDSALSGAFSCNVDLASASLSGAALAPEDCNQRVETIADQIERLQNF